MPKHIIRAAAHSGADGPDSLFRDENFQSISIPHGRRLMIAIQALSHEIAARFKALLYDTSEMTERIVANTIFVAGPALAVFAHCFRLAARYSASSPRKVGFKIVRVREPAGSSKLAPPSPVTYIRCNL